MGYTCGRHLTKKLCHSIAKKYSSIGEFSKGDTSAYKVSLKNGWIDTWFKRNHINKMTEELCIQIAKKCNSRSSFKKLSHSAYIYSMNNELIDKFTWFKKTSEIKKSLSQYSDNDVINASKAYTSLSDFIRYRNSMYILALKRGLLHDFTWLKRHCDIDNNGFYDYVYVYEFPDKHAYIGRTVVPHDRDIDHRNSGDVVYEYAKCNNMEIPEPIYLHSKITVKEGIYYEGMEMRRYQDNGWTLLNTAPSGSIGGLGAGKLTKEYCIKIASKYTYWQDLAHHESSVYNKIKNNNWNSDFQWLKYKNNHWENLTNEELIAHIKEYESRNDLMRHGKGLYCIAVRRDILRLCFPQGHSTPKTVGQYDSTGTLIETYSSISEAARALNVKSPCISAVCNNKKGKHTIKGFVFRFI